MDDIKHYTVSYGTAFLKIHFYTYKPAAFIIKILA